MLISIQRIFVAVFCQQIRSRRFAALVGLASIGSAVQFAEAGSVSNLQVINLSSPSFFQDDPTTGIKREALSSTSLLSSNLAAPMPTLSARLAGMVAMDTEQPAPTQTAAIDLAMRITFDVVAAPTESWTISVDQLRNFALTLAADPPTNGFQSQAIVNQHSATYSISPGGAGSLQFPTAGGEDTTATFGNVDVPISQSVVDVLGGSGSATVQLDFSQRLWAHSFANDNPNATVLAPGQEAAVRFGMLGSLTNVSADDYPGPGARVAVDDGHFVNVKVTFVPEPTGAALLGLGCVGVLVARRRKLGGK